jgi:hypothetical protein
MSIAPTAEPNRLGVIGGDLQGFPNGRRLGDDVIDIALQVMEGAATDGIVEALAAGDGVDANDEPFLSTFPYVTLPHDTAVNTTTSTSVVPPAGGGGGDGGGIAGHRVPIAAAALGAALVAMVMAAVTRRRRAVPA